MQYSEDRLKNYAAPLSPTEDEKCKNAISMVKDALSDLGFRSNSILLEKIIEDTYAYSSVLENALTRRKVKIFIQGSYANDTNVRTQSDVDIAVVQEDMYETEHRYGVTNERYGLTHPTISIQQFKNEVQAALVRKFSIASVERKNKSIKIHGNTYRKDADSVPCRRLRDYRNDFANNQNNYVGGIVIQADDGTKVINYPEQHIINGRKKNNETNYYYKKMVKILKNIRYDMQDANIASASSVSSFVLESLFWNIPNENYLGLSLYRYLFGRLVLYVYNNISKLDTYKEANGIKPLCASASDLQKLDRFIRDLLGFYQYI